MVSFRDHMLTIWKRYIHDRCCCSLLSSVTAVRNKVLKAIKAPPPGGGSTLLEYRYRQGHVQACSTRVQVRSSCTALHVALLLHGENYVNLLHSVSDRGDVGNDRK